MWFCFYPSLDLSARWGNSSTSESEKCGVWHECAGLGFWLALVVCMICCIKWQNENTWTPPCIVTLAQNESNILQKCRCGRRSHQIFTHVSVQLLLSLPSPDLATTKISIRDLPRGWTAGKALPPWCALITMPTDQRLVAREGGIASRSAASGGGSC